LSTNIEFSSIGDALIVDAAVEIRAWSSEDHGAAQCVRRCGKL